MDGWIGSRAQHFSFEFVPIPRPYPSAATYAHPCPPIAWHVPTHTHLCYSNCAYVFKNRVMYATCLHQVLVGSDKYPERFLVSVFPASEKFDSDLELDAGMHKIDAHPCPLMNNNIAPMHAHPWIITSHPCPPKTHGYGWAWAPNVGLW
jgi:hypothetical protein